MPAKSTGSRDASPHPTEWDYNPWSPNGYGKWKGSFISGATGGAARDAEHRPEIGPDAESGRDNPIK